MINKNFLYAVVGASNNEEKYGYKVFQGIRFDGYGHHFFTLRSESNVRV